jgi:hypothetical protein
MKGIKYFSLILIFPMMSCNNASKLREKKDTIKVEISVTCLEGVWAENKEDNALFYIKGDSIYYLESMKHPLFCKLNRDTLIINGEVMTKFYIKKLTIDSLWFSTNFYDEVTKLYKRK